MAAIEMRPDYCGHPQLYQTWVQYIHVIARPSALPAARSSMSSGTSTVRIIVTFDAISHVRIHETNP